MFVRTSSRRNKDGRKVSYLQLAHNQWDPASRSSRMRVLYNFGRAESVDRAGIERLIASLSRLVDAPVLAGPASSESGEGLGFVESRPLGGAWALDGLWGRLGIGTAITKMLGKSRRDAELTERVLFALVANRALAPSSKLAAACWVSEDVHIGGLGEVSDDACYRAMDALVGVEDELAKTVYGSTADLLNLEVDLLFFDTTSTYFETETADDPVARDTHGRPLGETETEASSEVGFRTYGKSKDHRDDLPQVVVGMAVTRTGIPVRVWCWPGNTSDSALIRQVKADMRDWNLSRVVWVADRGFTSAANRRYLQRAGGGYILGEKLRSGSAEAKAALARAGRYQTVADNLRVKQVRLDDGDRFVIAHNPEAAEHDATVRARLVERLTEISPAPTS